MLKRLLILLLLLPCTLSAQEPPVDSKQLVMEHLADSYSWHITAVGSHHLSVPLPVIVRGSDGWHLFSSRALEHNATYRGFTIATEGPHKGKIVEAATGERPLDLSLTKNALAILINSLIIILLILPLARYYRRAPRADRQGAPKGLSGCVEMVIEYLHDEVIVPCVGDDHRRYAPWLLSLFFWILVSNLMGLVPLFPGGANVTGNIAVTFALALGTFVVVNVSGTREYWREILWPEVPVWLKAPVPLMPVVELLGIFTKPFALMIRLFANIFAGHAVILALVSVIFVTASMGAAINGGMGALAVFFGIFMIFLELLVAFIQAYVFTLLSAVFVGMARVKHAKHSKNQ